MKNNCILIDNGMCVTAYGKATFCCMINDQGVNVTDDLKNYNALIAPQRVPAQTPGDDGFLKVCRGCKVKEDAGVRSRRVRYIDKAKQDKIVDGKLQYLDISFGNTCNQMCVMCSSAFSSQWRKTDLEMKASGVSFREDTETQHGGKRVPNNWHLSREKLDEIISLCDENLVQVDIKGGEPVYDKSFEYFVAAIIKKSPKVRISISTNLTKLSESRLEFIKTIPHINFGLSIDGIGKNYEWVRGWHDWNIIDNNTRRLMSALQPSQNASVNFTLNRYNMKELLNVWNYVCSIGTESQKKIYLYLGQIATSPHSMSPRAADANEALHTLEHLRIIKETNHEWARIDLSHQGLVNYCNTILDTANPFPAKYSTKVWQSKMDIAHNTIVKARGWDINDFKT